MRVSIVQLDNNVHTICDGCQSRGTATLACSVVGVEVQPAIGCSRTQPSTSYMAPRVLHTFLSFTDLINSNYMKSKCIIPAWKTLDEVLRLLLQNGASPSH